MALKIRTIIPAAVLAVLLAAPAYAHFPWITLHDQNGAIQQFEIGWGHDFPGDGLLDPDRVESIRLIFPDGDERKIAADAGPPYSLSGIETAGTHIIEAIQKGSYYSRTTQGGRRGSRADHPNAISCGFSTNTMKAFFPVDHGNGDVEKSLGHDLEIIPLADPASLSSGDRLPVKVTFQGKPFTDSIYASWDGYNGDDAFALALETSEEGLAEVPIENDGLWIIMANTSEDYPDPDVCDQHAYTATLTFRTGH